MLASVGFNPWMLFVVVMLLIFVARVVVIAARQENPSRVERALAKRLRGSVVNAPEWVVIVFKIRGRSAELTLPRRSDRPGQTAVQVDMRGDSPGMIQIVSERRAKYLVTRNLAGGVPTGDLEFDSRWIVRAVPESLAREIFSPGRRARVIGSIERLALHAGTTLDLSRERLVVRVLEPLYDESLLLDLVRVAEEFLAIVL